MVLPESVPVTDERLVKLIDWPKGLSAHEIRKLIDRAERFIDFDDTLVHGRDELSMTFYGRDLREFLAEKPFIIQSWRIGRTQVWTFVVEERFGEKFLRRAKLTPTWFPDPPLPRPLLVLTPPGMHAKIPEGAEPHRFDIKGERLYKDLYALGVRSGEVYDDDPLHMHAPGCTIISEF